MAFSQDSSDNGSLRLLLVYWRLCGGAMPETYRTSVDLPAPRKPQMIVNGTVRSGAYSAAGCTPAAESPWSASCAPVSRSSLVRISLARCGASADKGVHERNVVLFVCHVLRSGCEMHSRLWSIVPKSRRVAACLPARFRPSRVRGSARGCSLYLCHKHSLGTPAWLPPSGLSYSSPTWCP